MNHLKLNILLATAAVAPALALIVAWLAGGWLPSTWLMRASVVTIAMVVAGVAASLIMARLARNQFIAWQYLAQLCSMDDNQIIHNVMPDGTDKLPPDSPWHGVFRILRDRLAGHCEQLRAAEMSRAAIEVRSKRNITEQQRTASILANLTEPVLAVNEYDELVLANTSAEALFGFQIDPTEKRIAADLVRCEELIDLLHDSQRRKTGGLKTRELEIVDAEGRRQWYSVASRPTGDESEGADECKGPRGAVAVLRNIQTQKEIQKRNAEFISSVSHEMKTPLAGIKAYVELLADGDAEDEKTQEEFLAVINSQTDRLQRLIDNLLNLARIEAGVVTVNKQPHSLNELLEEAYQVVHPAAEQKQIELVRELSPMFLGAFVDRDMLLQAAINLLSNAIKYTPAGRGVTLRSRLLGNDVLFEIEDQGVGLSAEDQEKVFEKFYRVKKDQNMAPGTGLGLPLARHVIRDVHGGQLTLQSELGVGSTFSVRSPLRRRSVNPVDLEPIQPHRPRDMTKRILLCDDEVHVLKAAEIKFRRAGFDVRCVSDGEEAWETMQQWLPDILVTDFQMPRLDGVSLSRRCREHEHTRRLPIIMLTAKGYELMHGELAQTCGVNAILPKPFSPRELVQRVQQTLEIGITQTV